MLHRHLITALALVAALLAACGNEQPAAPSGALAAPSTALAAAAQCEGAESSTRGPVSYRAQGGQCWRSSTVLDAPVTTLGVRKRALAAAPSRLATPAELFNWAEVVYADLFPSRRSDLRLATYTYRYYPESQNHVAVSEGRVYVQGPVSGGELLYVGTVEEFSCRAVPSLCSQPPADCAPLTQWAAADGSVCLPDSGQTAPIAHGARYTYTDNVTPLFGVAPMQCDNGVLRALDVATCSAQAPVACNTGGLTWAAGVNQCTPNPTEPTQIASGSSYIFSDSVQTNGRASYRCHNGSLTAVDSPSCNPRPAFNCTPNDIEWTVSGVNCSASSKPIEQADGTDYTYVDSGNGPVGSAVFRCTPGGLQLVGTPACALPSILDSFGDNGGSADGGASGDGTAADGAPIVGAAVRVIDTGGRVATATTDSRGYWRVRLTGMVPPLVVRVAHPDGRVRHSISLQPLRTNGYIFIAVTGLTDKIVSDLARSGGAGDGPVGAGALTAARLASLGSTTVNSMVSALRNHPVVRPALVEAGINPDTFDPLHTPFRPNGAGYDRVLDKLVVDFEDGATVLRNRICSINEVSWTVGGNTCTAGSPSLLILLQPGSTVTLPDTSGSTRGAATFVCERGLPRVSGTAVCNLQ